jgi:hypothetical protein
MSQIKFHLQSFNSGELSETMASRFGVEKVATGCRQLRNMLPHVHGPAEKRPGMQWLGAAHNPAIAPRLLEFNFSATTRFIIEFGVGVFRIWNVATAALQTTLATVAHPYAQAEWWEVQARQVNDVVYLTHPNHHPRRLTRRANNDWVCELMPLTYPPLLDEYVTPDLGQPVITPLLESRLEMAPEFEVQPLPDNPIPSMQSEPSGVTDSPWFQVNWNWPSAVTAPTTTLTLQVVNTAGDWVDAGVVPISTTSTPPPAYQFAFQPAGTNTSVLVRRREWTGSTWSSWVTAATVVLTLPSGSTAATMPALLLRFVAGPLTRSTFQLLNGLLVEPITAATGPLAEVGAGGFGYLGLNLKYEAPISGDLIFTWSMPSTVPTGRTMILQYLNGSTWTNLVTFTLAASMTTRTFRLRRSSTNLLLEEKGATEYTTATTVANTNNGPWRLRLFTASAPIAGTVTVSFSLPNFAQWHTPWSFPSIVRAIERTPSATGDTGSGGVTVQAGWTWRLFVDIPIESEIPAGARLRLQARRASTDWRTLNTYDLTSLEGLSIEEDGRVFGQNEFVRAIYDSTGGLAMAGTAFIERVVIPAPSEVTLQVNGTSGNGRTMTASAALFQAGHVGSFWQIAHRRDLAFTELVGVVGVFPAGRLTSKPLRIFGSWDLFSYGTWKGTVFLERKVSGGWQVVRSWSGNKDRNIIANGLIDTDAEYRIRLATGFRGFAASGADVPRFVLEAADSRTYGLVKVTGFTSATQVTVDIVRSLASRDATSLWAEGAWSGVRGYPAAVGIHEGRLWFGGSTHQPSGLWASVSNDFENFRRGTTDDASIMVSLAAETGSQIQWLSSSDDALMIGTGGEEWTIRSNFEGQPITPSNIKAGRRGAYSSARLPARVTQDSALFVQRNERKIRQANYSATDGQFTASDMTVLSPHLFLSGIKQMALTQSPWNVAWVVLGNGKLAAMTFEREQNVFAWSLHETAGLVRSVAVAVGVTSDQVWLSVERNGVASIERFDPAAVEREVSNWKRLIYCDAAVVRTGPGTAFTAEHLANRQVVGLADGVPFVQTADSSGQITFPSNRTDVVMGLAFEAKIQPMRLELPMRDGTSQARRVKVARVGAEVIESFLGPKVADGDDGVFDSLPIETPSPAGPWSGMAETAIEGRTDDAVNVVVKDSAPFPFMLGGLVLKLDVYGD